MPLRTVEDRLREQYFDLLPEIRRIVDEIDARVRYALLPISQNLSGHERLVVNSRIKSCESSIDKLRRQQHEGGTFDPSAIDDYTLLALKDLAAVRIMAFPRTRITEIEHVLRGQILKSWAPEPFREGPAVGFKFVGTCSPNSAVRAEYQIVPLLTGLFWEVEHAAIYKPAVVLRGTTTTPTMKRKANEVLLALQEFEAAFVHVLKEREGPP